MTLLHISDILTLDRKHHKEAFPKGSVALRGRMEKLLRVVTRGGLLVVLLLLVTVPGSVLADLEVSPHSQYCMQHPSFLSCDFKGTQEVVTLDSLHTRGGKTVNTIYIHNAGQVVVGEICVSLVAFSVANITYTAVPQACNPEQSFIFKLADSSTNLVPPYITQLDLQRSEAKDVILKRDLKAFSVVHSDIDHLEVYQPTQRLAMKVEHSVVDNLEKLHLEGKSSLVLYNVTINEMKQKSLHLKDSMLSIWASNIKTSLGHAIVLGHKSSVNLKDMDGRVSLVGPEELPAMPVQATPQTQEERRAPGVPPKTPKVVKAPPCNRPSIMLWVLPTALAAVEGIVIIINCTNWFPALKARRAPHGPEEGQGAVRQRQPESTAAYSTWYYNSEVPMMSTSRRQNIGVDKYK